MFVRLCLGLILYLFSPAGLPAQPIMIRSIDFEGNERFSSSQLKDRIRISREGAWYSAEALLVELQAIERLYRDNGFLNVRIGPPRIETQAEGGQRRLAAIVVPVSEGPLYKVGSISVRGATVFSAATLLQMSPLGSGQPYSRDKISAWAERIRESYLEMGYIRFQASPREDALESAHTVDCALELSEGAAYHVGIIKVANPAVDAAEFKRRLLVSEGGVYDPTMLAYSIQFLNQSRQFKPFGREEIDIQIDDRTRTVDLVFHIVPLKQPGLRPQHWASDMDTLRAPALLVSRTRIEAEGI